MIFRVETDLSRKSLLSHVDEVFKNAGFELNEEIHECSSFVVWGSVNRRYVKLHQAMGKLRWRVDVKVYARDPSESWTLKVSSCLSIDLVTEDFLQVYRIEFEMLARDFSVALSTEIEGGLTKSNRLTFVCKDGKVLRRVGVR